MPNPFTKLFDDIAKGVRSISESVLHEVVERPWFSRTVTPRSQATTIDLTGGLSPAEKLGWFQRREHGEQPIDPGMHERAKDAAAHERGIDL